MWALAIIRALNRGRNRDVADPICFECEQDIEADLDRMPDVGDFVPSGFSPAIGYNGRPVRVALKRGEEGKLAGIIRGIYYTRPHYCFAYVKRKFGEAVAVGAFVRV